MELMCYCINTVNPGVWW